jgi:nitroreductase
MSELKTTFLDLIKYRRSVFPKDYIDKPISKEILLELLKCAVQAPTHKLTQPWKFTVFTGDGLVKLAEELKKQYKKSVSKGDYESIQKKILQSGAVIAICFHETGKIAKWEEIAAVASAVQNLALAASAQDIGSYWSSSKLINELDSFLNLSKNESCIGLFYMGYHKEKRSLGKRLPIREKVTWVE